jgi:hypothetical protein
MKVVIIFWFSLLCTSCLNTSTNSKLVVDKKSDPIFNIYNLDTLRYLITKDSSEIKKMFFPADVILRDTTFESDEGLSWNGFVFYQGSQILLIAESSWECKKIIKRITVLSSNIAGSIPLKIGTRFKDIKSYVSQTIPSYPDGYFGLKDKVNGQITYFFYIDDNYDLGIGNIKFETIPDTLLINQILIE